MRKKGFYAVFLKRLFDIVGSFLGIIVLSPLLIIIAILVRIKLGAPVIFKQTRPGKNEKPFMLYKFRTMTNKKDEQGKLLPDDVRLTKFGRLLRSTSLDELPELFNIFTGKMSIIGPRPQLMIDMFFMTESQRKRHNVRPGLTGLAQVKGRNAITWEEKFQYDLEYIEKITFWRDIKIFFQTFVKVFKKEGITQGEMQTAEDLGDYLLRVGAITNEEYDKVNRSFKEHTT